jgi:periplasmic copper chaperone A
MHLFKPFQALSQASGAAKALLVGGALVIASVVGHFASAHGFSVGEIVIEHPYATATPPGLKNGAAYFKAIKNNGKQADKLVSAQTSSAGSVEIHTMSMDGNVMRMREVSGIDLPAGGATVFGQGTDKGYHLMLMNLKDPLKDGDSFKLKLKFEKAGDTEVVVQVQKARPSANEHKHH